MTELHERTFLNVEFPNGSTVLEQFLRLSWLKERNRWILQDHLPSREEPRDVNVQPEEIGSTKALMATWIVLRRAFMSTRWGIRNVFA